MRKDIKDINEILSAFVDGEHDKNNNILEKLIHDDDIKSSWKRYHLIRDCLRGNLPNEIHNNFTKKVNKRLEYEANINASKKTKRFKQEPLIGFALAASVAILAILSIQYKTISPSMATKDIVVMDQTIVEPQFETFTFPEAPVSPAAVKKSTNSITEQRLNNYLINHSKYKHSIRMNSVLPYARIVTIEPKE